MKLSIHIPKKHITYGVMAASFTALSALTVFAPTEKTYAAAGTIKTCELSVIDTSAWSPPSPDPAGIVYDSATGRLVISDSEVNEMTIFQGSNVFESTLTGTLVATGSTTSFSNEPTDVAINPADGHRFYSDDNADKVTEVDPGADGIFHTSDDVVRSFSTNSYGVQDAEGVAYGNGTLFIADGVGNEIFVITPGANGIFDGAGTIGDDQFTHFDTGGSVAVNDPEGVAWDAMTGNLFIVGTYEEMAEVTTSGTPINHYDLTAIPFKKPAGITIAPSSADAAKRSFYVADRKVDNDSDPNENDGKIYELAITAADCPVTEPAPSPTDPTAPAEPTGNRLLNPSFEIDADNNGSPDNWSKSNRFTRSADATLTGSYSGKHAFKRNSNYTVLQKVDSLTAGATYTVSGSANIPATTDSFSYRLDVRWLNSSGSQTGTSTIKTYNASTAGWDTASANVVAPSGTTAAEIRMTMSSLRDVVYVDDISFSRL